GRSLRELVPPRCPQDPLREIAEGTSSPPGVLDPLREIAEGTRSGYHCLRMADMHLDTLPFSAWGLGLERPLRIAGPCRAESRAQVLDTADGILAHAPQVQVFRAGIWKPRTRPGGFEGVGEAALPWLMEAKARTGLLAMTEVATPQH